MPTVGQIERLTQDRVVALFQKQLGYDYLGNWEDRENNSNIEEDILRKYLTERGYSQTIIGKAIYELTQAATNQSKSLYDINKDVYTMLRYGVKVKEDVGENTKTVWLIDFIGIPRSSAAVGTNDGQCNLNRLSHEMPHSSAVGSFTRASKHKRERPNNRTPEADAEK
jgi:hypothetical protein